MIDFGALFSQLISSFWWLLPLLVLASLLKSPWFKGVKGEFMVNMAARLFLDKTKYHLIKNVTIPTEDGTIPDGMPGALQQSSINTHYGNLLTITNSVTMLRGRCKGDAHS